MPRISEEQLILPSLYLMDISENKTISTTEMKEKLVSIFKPTGEDARLSTTRPNETVFMQIVGNLKSHNTLENLNYATYNERQNGQRSGSFTLTPVGKEFLDANMNVINYLLNNDFKSEDLKEALNIVYNNRARANTIQTFDENTTINEGTQVVTQTNIYKRSKKLREEAIRYYTVDDKIKCRVCCFNFEDFYGEYGRGFIEIHHQKPIFQFNGDDTEQTITEALRNVIPVCSNCHRMIHRRRENPLSLEEIRSYVRNDLDFCD
ncbi:HNH endonuclease [Aliarcobacter skirrowii]|uniref:HNH endonuclease n=1 Tax=Aliarcobacter skirrowii TaxID=28200 RepID=UPI00082A430E|nr:HNH endonuclease [Aliarcobacter skirrowii]